MVMCTLVLFLLASGNRVRAAATGFEAPGDGDYVLIGKEVDINYLGGVTANNRQTYCKITIEAPDGETTDAFLSYDAYAGFMANTSFTPTQEGIKSAKNILID